MREFLRDELLNVRWLFSREILGCLLWGAVIYGLCQIH
jgi:hypothetical protein